MKDDLNAAESGFGQDYAQWKAWDDDAFAVLTPLDAADFAAQLRDSGVPMRPGLRVLELGFGQGRFLAWARAQGCQVTGQEVNPHLVALALRQGWDVREAADVQAWPDASFDLVVALDVLEHVPAADTLPLLRDVLRVLRPGGALLARFPNGDSPFGLMHQNGDATHVQAIGSGKVRHWAQALNAQLRYVGPQAQPVWGVGLFMGLYRLAVWPVRAVTDWFVRLFFLGGAPVAFSATNLVMVLGRQSLADGLVAGVADGPSADAHRDGTSL